MPPVTLSALSYCLMPELYCLTSEEMHVPMPCCQAASSSPSPYCLWLSYSPSSAPLRPPLDTSCSFVRGGDAGLDRSYRPSRCTGDSSNGRWWGDTTVVEEDLGAGGGGTRTAEAAPRRWVDIGSGEGGRSRCRRNDGVEAAEARGAVTGTSGGPGGARGRCGIAKEKEADGLLTGAPEAEADRALGRDADWLFCPTESRGPASLPLPVLLLMLAVVRLACPSSRR